MKKLLIASIMFLGFTAVNAQNAMMNVETDVVVEKVDKNTSMAFVYQNDILLEKGLLVNGKREGVWQSFNADGTLTTEASFSKGVKNGVWNIYDGADLKYVLHYQNGSRVQANNLAIAQ